MKKEIPQQYKMATKAIHKLGDIGRETPDICIIAEEDEANYYGNWVFGFGLIDVQFPKTTTRDLNAEEIEKYHGQPTMIGKGFAGTINIIGEDFHKHVVVTKVNGGKVHSGILMSSLKVGRMIAMNTDNGFVWHSSTIQSINGSECKTKNSTYQVEYV